MKWECDQRSPGEPPSMGILLTWLTMPGNYERWHSEVKWELAHDIVVAIKAAGNSRSPSGVFKKIHAVEKQYASATAWLSDLNIRRDGVSLGDLEQQMQTQLDKLCPKFFDLHPVFQAFFSASGERIDESGTTRKRKGTDRSLEATRASKRLHRLSTEAAIPHVEEKPAPSTGAVRGGQMMDRVCEAQLTPALQQRLDECLLNHAEQRSRGILAAEEKVRKCSINAEHHRTDIEVMLAKVLARQTMKENGGSTTEIEAAMPLHGP